MLEKRISLGSKKWTWESLRSRIGAGRFLSNLDPTLYRLSVAAGSLMVIESHALSRLTDLQELWAHDMDLGASISPVLPLLLGTKPMQYH